MSKLLTRKTLPLFLLLSTLFELTHEISFPWLVSRDYSYKEALQVYLSTELTSTGRPYHFEDRSNKLFGSKDPKGRKRMNIPFALKELDFMCHPGDNAE